MTSAAAIEADVGTRLRTEGAIVRAPGDEPTIEAFTLRPLERDDVVVDVAAAGLCHSDISLASGKLHQPMPVVLGHEASGVISWCGPDVAQFRPGDRVVLDWSPSCGACYQCVEGRPYLCTQAGNLATLPHGTTEDDLDVYAALGTGAFARQVVRPANAIHRVPSEIEFPVSAIMGCAVLTGVGAVVNAAKVAPGQTVAVVGLGGVGLSAIQAARVAGASQVIAIDTNRGKETLARRVGADVFAVPDEESSLTSLVREATEGRGADHVIDCVGRTSTVRASWSATKRGGCTTLVGIGSKQDLVEFNALELFHFARTLQGCVYGSSHVARDLELLFRLQSSGRLRVDELITANMSLDELSQDLPELIARSQGRTVIEFSGR